jgi:hypothetical protein
LDSAWPEPRKKLPPRPSTLDPYKAVIDGILRADLDAPRKQRHTVTRIFHRLIEEHGADVSYPMVRRYVADRKPQIAVEAGKAPIEAFVPQTHPPGMEAEVDFGDVAVRLAGELVTCYLFSFRLSYSGKAVHRVFASSGQEAFFEGHVHALRVLGGVPRGRLPAIPDDLPRGDRGACDQLSPQGPPVQAGERGQLAIPLRPADPLWVLRCPGPPVLEVLHIALHRLTPALPLLHRKVRKRAISVA